MFELPLSSPPPALRACQPCTACCVALPIPAGLVDSAAKPGGVPCRWMGSAGCNNYTGRPDACRTFQCAWLNDPHWPAAWRPDRSGLLCLREWVTGSMMAAAVYELRSRALTLPVGQAVLAELQETCAIVAVTDFEKRRYNLPPAAKPVRTDRAEPDRPAA